MVQMPALNTLQFDWACNKMTRRPQPVPPIFQPEIASDAIVYAARSRRREVWVGGSSVQAIVANSGPANYSLQLWATKHWGALVAGTLAVAAFITTLIVGGKPLVRAYQTSSEPARLDEPVHKSG